MENKEKVQEAIKQTESKISQLGIELANLKAELDKPTRVEVAADGAILQRGGIAYYLAGNGSLQGVAPVGPNDVKYLSSYATKEQGEDELLRREISCHIRRRACELNDNHDWRKMFGSNFMYCIAFTRGFVHCVSVDGDISRANIYFSNKEHAQTVANELNAKYSPETIKRLYFSEAK